MVHVEWWGALVTAVKVPLVLLMTDLNVCLVRVIQQVILAG